MKQAALAWAFLQNEIFPSYALRAMCVSVLCKVERRLIDALGSIDHGHIPCAGTHGAHPSGV